MIRTWLTDTFGLDVPVAAATMAGPSDGGFAAAGAAAGILGGLGVGPSATAEWVVEQAARAGAGGGPYCIGLMAWALDRDPGPLESALAARPAAIGVSFGDIGPYVARIRDAGIPVLSQVGTTAQARAAVDAEVDAVIARGGEGGGHGYDRVATLPLLQAVLDAVDVPVLAGGGIATARGLAAVIAAGAAGAWVGTALATCRESAWPDDLVARLAEADEDGTRYGHVFDQASRAGWPTEIGGRAVANDFFARWLGRESELTDTQRQAFRDSFTDRDFSTMPIYAGQGSALFDGRRRPVAEIVADLARAEQLLVRAAGRVRPAD
ncbi:NAD(P)H-dependent flavin oxidoreductase [Propionibacteriaceae bacterium Y2011]|uniref:NAD(P)H-dependent flavin oxidoreductase n=1 Tax=Microlunatus sp. Y2014 TaxID=3418488 RepID=UPI003B4CF440